MLVDCHAHIADPVFDADRTRVLAEARAAGIVAVVAVGETLADARRNLVLAAEHPEVLPAAGLHPTRVDAAEGAAIAELLRTERRRFVAVGEVGLDRWKVTEPPELELQREIFTSFVKLAVELDLPLNVHSRSAGREAIAVLQEHGAKRVQLHAFDGRPASAAGAVEAGYYFSIPPSVVRSRQKQKLVKRLPLELLLLETDSPVLGPTPGERNVPANARIALEAIAEIKGKTVDEVAEAVAANTRRLYGDALTRQS
jgi:TatD DNase family protein